MLRLKVGLAMMGLLCGGTVPVWAQCSVPKERIPAELPPGVRQPTEALYSENPEERMLGACQLGELRAKEAIPFLVGLLQDHGPTHQKKMHVWNPPDVYWGLTLSSPGREAAKALAKIGAPSVDPLMEALKNNAAAANAIWALGEMREPKAVEFLLGRPDDAEAMMALGKLREPRAAPGLVNSLGNMWVKETAAQALFSIGKPAMEPLLAALGNQELKDQKLPIRVYAAETLGRMGDPQAVVPLCAAAAEAIPDLRWRSIEALGLLASPGDTQAVELFRGALKDEDWRIREVAAATLGKLNATATAKDLTLLLKDKDVTVRGRAAQALGALQSKEAAAGLLALLDDKQLFARRCAVEALAGLKEPRAVEPIAKMLQAKEPAMRRQAAQALGTIGDAKGVRPLLDILADNDEALRQAAGTALGKIGAPASAPLAEAMKNTKDGPNAWNFLNSARVAAAKIGAPAVGDLARLLSCGNWMAECTAGGALVEIGEPGVAALLEAAKTGSARAAQALGKVPNDPRVPEALAAALKTGNDFAKTMAAESLGNLKPRAAVAFDALVATLSDRSNDVKNKAEWALEQITGQILGHEPGKWQEWWKGNREKFLQGK